MKICLLFPVFFKMLLLQRGAGPSLDLIQQKMLRLASSLAFFYRAHVFLSGVIYCTCACVQIISISLCCGSISCNLLFVCSLVGEGTSSDMQDPDLLMSDEWHINTLVLNIYWLLAYCVEFKDRKRESLSCLGGPLLEGWTHSSKIDSLIWYVNGGIGGCYLSHQCNQMG